MNTRCTFEFELLNVDGSDLDIARTAHREGVVSSTEALSLTIASLIIQRFGDSFDQSELTFELNMPGFVWYELGLYLSSYRVFEDDLLNQELSFYIPIVSPGGGLVQEFTEEMKTALLVSYGASYNTYKLNRDRGMSHDIARLGLPVSMYSRGRIGISVYEIFEFVNKAPYSIPEIGRIAGHMYSELTEAFPVSKEMFEIYGKPHLALSGDET